MDELNLEANAGSLECSLLLGDLESAMSRVMFLQEMYSTQVGWGQVMCSPTGRGGVDVQPYRVGGGR